MSLLDDLVRNADEIADGYNEYRAVIDGTTTEVNIPKNINVLYGYRFYNMTSLKKISLPDSITTIGASCFQNCINLENINFPTNLKEINSYAFNNCPKLSTVILPHGVEELGSGCFEHGEGITRLHLPNTITYLGYGAFNYAYTSDAVITLENGFNANGLDLSRATLALVEDILGWLNALADRSGEQAHTLYIGSTNLNKLTSEQIAIATNKNWNLA